MTKTEMLVFLAAMEELAEKNDMEAIKRVIKRGLRDTESKQSTNKQDD
jgi:hypothetical protein